MNFSHAIEDVSFHVLVYLARFLFYPRKDAILYTIPGRFRLADSRLVSADATHETIERYHGTDNLASIPELLTALKQMLSGSREIFATRNYYTCTVDRIQVDTNRSNDNRTIITAMGHAVR